MLVKMNKKDAATRPTREEAEDSVRTLLAYLGEDVSRPGLLETPARVVRAWEEWCDGYKEDASELVGKFFDDIQGYDQPVIMRNINFVSHCEHHMANMPGVAHVAYWPDKKVVGISKLARVVDVFANRLQSQETLTKQIAEALHAGLSPKGVAVLIEAEHACMTTRGANKADAHLVTQFFTGCFKTDLQAQERITGLLTGAAPRSR